MFKGIYTFLIVCVFYEFDIFFNSVTYKTLFNILLTILFQFFQMSFIKFDNINKPQELLKNYIIKKADKVFTSKARR